MYTSYQSCITSWTGFVMLQKVLSSVDGHGLRYAVCLDSLLSARGLEYIHRGSWGTYISQEILFTKAWIIIDPDIDCVHNLWLHNYYVIYIWLKGF